MLPKLNRLTERREYNKVKKYGKSYFYPYFIINCLKSYNQEELKFGIIVTNKFVKSAVKRHRAKRVLYDIIHKRLSTTPRGFLFIIVPREAILNAKYEDVSTFFNKVLSEISLP